MQVSGSTSAPRARAAISCTECHKRRKRCSEGQPCQNCARRYPPVECIYKPHPKRRPNRPISTDEVECEQSTLSQPPRVSKVVETQETPSDEEIFSRHVSSEDRSSSSHHGSKLPSRRRSSELESQVPVCGLVNTSPDVLNPAISPSDVVAVAKQFEDQSTLPSAFGNGVMDVLRLLKVEPTANNAELFSIYTKVLVPWHWTVDGNAVEEPPGCWQSWIPYSIFSPMILYTSLHRAAIWREMVRPTAFRVEVNSKAIADVLPECIVLRGKALTLLRNHLSSSSLDASSDEAVSTIACIFFNEWSWCIEHGTRDILPHIKALRAMLKMRGGMSKVSSHAAGLLMIIHYQTAAILERRPWVFPADLLKDKFISDYHPVKSRFDSPLFMSSGSFTEKGCEVGLHAITAQTLDDLTIILNDVRSVIHKNSDSERGKILRRAIGIQDRVLSLRSANEPNHPTANDYIYETCRLASLVYLRAIINHTQFSKAWHPEELQEMYKAITMTPMHYWKPLSGVWVFVLLSINPSRDELYPNAKFKFFLKTSCFHIVTWDWQCWVNIMETYLALQKWIREPGDSQVLSSWSPVTTSDVRDFDDIQAIYGMRPV